MYWAWGRDRCWTWRRDDVLNWGREGATTRDDGRWWAMMGDKRLALSKWAGVKQQGATRAQMWGGDDGRDHRWVDGLLIADTWLPNIALPNIGDHNNAKSSLSLSSIKKADCVALWSTSWLRRSFTSNRLTVSPVHLTSSPHFRYLPEADCVAICLTSWLRRLFLSYRLTASPVAFLCCAPQNLYPSPGPQHTQTSVFKSSYSSKAHTSPPVIISQKPGPTAPTMYLLVVAIAMHGIYESFLYI